DIKISVALTFMVVATIVLYFGCAKLLVSGRGMRQ
ncbi:MAG: ABC transporter permease, partial [Pseudomonas sp.]|nr:ABC transporter permease [Pseudomonas sp.]